MNRNLPTLGTLALMLAGARAAGAHVAYKDLDAAPVLVNTTYGGTAVVDPCTGKSTGCQSANNFTRFGWKQGTENILGDSHNLTTGANFWKFHVARASTTVTITFNAPFANNLLDPAFSVYAGLLPDAGHDDVPVDPLNPVAGGCSIASPKDAHAAPWTYQAHDGFRDTLNYTTTGGRSGCLPLNPFRGQFDAFASFSMANPGGAWANITYLSSVSATAFSGHNGGTHVTGNTGTTETLTLTGLGVGDYTIAAGGESCSTTTGACGAKFYGTVSYTHTP